MARKIELTTITNLEVYPSTNLGNHRTPRYSV